MCTTWSGSASTRPGRTNAVSMGCAWTVLTWIFAVGCWVSSGGEDDLQPNPIETASPTRMKYAIDARDVVMEQSPFVWHMPTVRAKEEPEASRSMRRGLPG